MEDFTREGETPQGANTAEIQALMNAIREVKNATCISSSQFENAKGSIVIVGDKGSGKSTLVNFLAGRPLEASEADSFVLSLDTQQPLEGSVISHGATPGTIMPHPCFEEQMSEIMWDCPGFEDPRESKEKVGNAFSLHQVLTNPLPIKLILVVEKSSITNSRGSAFLSNLKKMTDLFLDLDQLKSCLSLVVTKQDKIRGLSGFCQFLEREIGNTDVHESRTERVRELLQFLKESAEQRIAFFPYPKDVGAYDAEKTGIQKNILDIILNAQPIKNPQVEISIDPSAHEFIRDSADELNLSLANYLKSEGHKRIVDYCLGQIKSYQGKNLQGLRDESAELVAKLSDLSKVSSDKPSDFYELLTPYFDVDDIIDTIENISFLKSLNQKISYNTGAWAEALSETIKQIDTHLMSPPQVNYGNAGVVYVEGTLVSIEDVNEAIQRTPHLISCVQVSSCNTLLVNKNMSIPGISCSFIAPCVSVVGQPLINLCGQSGTSGMNGYGPGSPGSPGLPGGNGGHFYAKANTFHNVNSLIIQANGGNGGAGGNGAKGADGADGEDGNLEKVTNSVTYGPNQVYQCGRYIEREKGTISTYNDQGKNGKDGKNGGQQGAGGKGGYGGTILIEGIISNHVPQNGQDGANGNPGTGGAPGLHGKNCTGTIKIIQKEHNDSRRTGSSSNFMNYGDPTQEDTRRYDLNRPQSYAHRGNPGVGVNVNGLQSPQRPIPLNPTELQEHYDAFYAQQVNSSNPFALPFNNGQ